MGTRTSPLKPEVDDSSRPGSPRWAQVAAWGAFACTVPSAIWRVLMIAGLTPGATELRMAHTGDHAYVWGLSIVQLVTGFLAVGLVRPWGERVRGIAVPRWLPVVLGTLGGLAVTYLFTVSMVVGLAQGQRPDQGLVNGWPLVVMVLCYAPIVLWGPLVLVAVTAYTRRRRS